MTAKINVSWRHIGVFTVAILTGILIGYVTAVIAGALLFVSQQFALLPNQQGLLVSIILVGGFVGSLICQYLIKPLGQKKSLILIAIMFFIGSLWSAYSKEFWLLIGARFFLGIAVGMATVLGPMYVAENSPDKHRGFFVGSIQLAITLGIFLAYIINYCFLASHNWSIMFALSALPALLLLIVALFQLESPGWLLLKGREHEAKQIYLRIHGIEWHTTNKTERHSSARVKLREIFQPIILPTLLFTCGLFLFQNLSGIDAILYYAPTIFQQAGFSNVANSLQITMLLGLINIIATLASMVLLDKAGRRPVLIYGLSLMCISLVSFSILSFFVLDFPLIKWLSALMLMLFVVAFAISMGPIPYVIMSELFPLHLRVIGIGLASATAWGINALITFAYPLLISIFGISAVFIGFAMVCFIALIISILFCPETNQLSLELIESRLKSGIALRNLGR